MGMCMIFRGNEDVSVRSVTTVGEIEQGGGTTTAIYIGYLQFVSTTTRELNQTTEAKGNDQDREKGLGWDLTKYGLYIFVS